MRQSSTVVTGVKKHVVFAGQQHHQSREFEDHRTEALFRVLEYNWIICPIGLICCFFASYYIISNYLLFRVIVDPAVWWTPDTLLCVLIGVCGQLSQILPFGYTISVCLPIRPFALRQSPKVRSFDRLIFCLVTRGDNVQTILNTVDNWDELLHLDPRVEFCIVLDKEVPKALQDRLPRFARVLLVPQDFQPPKAIYKVRALEYARLALGVGAEDWVLHLDEETQMDLFGTRACLDFIQRGDRQVGMGTIFYDSQGHWTNVFPTVGEITRITADFGRFRFPFATRGRPFLGWIHGSFLLINGEVENKVSWDTECLAEDFWFGLRAANMGYTFGWIDAIAREQPPRTLKDVWAQRKRWVSGIWSCNEPLARLSYAGCVTYFLGLSHSIYILFIREAKLLIPQWVLIWAVICCSEGLWSAITLTVAQDIDAGGIAPLLMAWHAVLTFFLTSAFNFMECVVVFAAILFPPRNFHVVAKT